MVVKVQSGTFAFRVQSEVLVDPEGEAIEILEANPPIPLGSNPDNNRTGRTFSLVGTVETCPGSAPNTLCLLDPDVLGENFVRLNEGDLVYLPDDTTCFFCNTTDVQAELLVWTPSTGFSWHRLYESERATAASTPVAQQQGAQVIQGWMFNPGGRCN